MAHYRENKNHESFNTGVCATSLWGAGVLCQAHAKVKTVKVSFGVSGGVFAKVCTRDCFPLYNIFECLDN